jgi:hypothetical protein
MLLEQSLPEHHRDLLAQQPPAHLFGQGNFFGSDGDSGLLGSLEDENESTINAPLEVELEPSLQ